jgi:hypothetical protein
MMQRYVFLGGLLTLLLFPTALGELTSFKLIYGGSGLDTARDIYVDSSGIYMVGATSSFGLNPPNAYLTIFNTDNTHRCSVAVDLGANEEGVGVAVHAGKVYLLGRTSSGSNPPNFFIAVFDATTCSFQTSKLYDLGPGEIATGIAVEPAATPAFYVSGFGSGIGGSFVMKLDSSLNPVWTVGYRVRSGNDIATDLVFSGGRIYVVGAADNAGDQNMYLTIFNSLAPTLPRENLPAPHQKTLKRSQSRGAEYT